MKKGVFLPHKESVKKLTRYNDTTFVLPAGSHTSFAGMGVTIPYDTYCSVSDIDTGSVVSGLVYNVFLVNNNNRAKLVMSLNDLLPTGYLVAKKIGRVTIGKTSDIALTNNTIEPITSSVVGKIEYSASSVPQVGFIAANGTTIGRASGTYSGTEFKALYFYAWPRCSTDSNQLFYISPIGASAQADWDAGKTITINVKTHDIPTLESKCNLTSAVSTANYISGNGIVSDYQGCISSQSPATYTCRKAGQYTINVRTYATATYMYLQLMKNGTNIKSGDVANYSGGTFYSEINNFVTTLAYNDTLTIYRTSGGGGTTINSGYLSVVPDSSLNPDIVPMYRYIRYLEQLPS